MAQGTYISAQMPKNHCTIYDIYRITYYLDLLFIGSQCKNTIIELPQVCLSFISLGTLAVEWIENWQSNEIENLSPIVNSLTLSNLVYLLCTFKVEHPVWLPNKPSRRRGEKRKENWSVGCHCRNTTGIFWPCIHVCNQVTLKSVFEGLLELHPNCHTHVDEGPQRKKFS